MSSSNKYPDETDEDLLTSMAHIQGDAKYTELKQSGVIVNVAEVKNDADVVNDAKEEFEHVAETKLDDHLGGLENKLGGLHVADVQNAIAVPPAVIDLTEAASIAEVYAATTSHKRNKVYIIANWGLSSTSGYPVHVKPAALGFVHIDEEFRNELREYCRISETDIGGSVVRYEFKFPADENYAALAGLIPDAARRLRDDLVAAVYRTRLVQPGDEIVVYYASTDNGWFRWAGPS